MLWQKFYYNESRDDKNKTLSVEEYLNKIRPYLKDITNYLKKISYMENSINDSNKIYVS